MKEMALELIARGLPFTMEKPMGMRAADVDEIIAAAEKARAFCAIPFVWRYSDTVAQLKEELLSGKIIHMSYRFIAGPPSRYLDTSPWMLHADTAGGGCMYFIYFFSIRHNNFKIIICHNLSHRFACEEFDFF